MTQAVRVVVIIGAASGLGLATNEHFAATTDDRLVLVDRSDAVRAVCGSLTAAGAGVVSLIADLSDLSAILDLTTRIKSAFGGCDVLINNAGVHPKKPDGGKYVVEEIALAQWQPGRSNQPHRTISSLDLGARINEASQLRRPWTGSDSAPRPGLRSVARAVCCHRAGRESGPAGGDRNRRGIPGLARGRLVNGAVIDANGGVCD